MSNKAFDINDLIFNSDETNGQELKEKHQALSGDKTASGAITWVKEKGKNTIRHLGPDENVQVDNIEKVGVTEPFDTAAGNGGKRKIRLTVQEEDWLALRNHLLQKDQLERQAFLELGMVENDQGIELFLYRILPVPDEEYITQHAVRVITNGRFTVDAYNSFADSGVPVHGHVHSHPFSRYGRFSGQDLACRSSMVQGINQVADALDITGSVFSLLMVMGTDTCGWYADLMNDQDKVLGQVNEIRLVSQHVHKTLRMHCRQEYRQENRKAEKTVFQRIFTPPGDVNKRDVSVLSIADQRLNRNLRLFGEEGQRIISSTHLAICGAGGAGSMLAANLRGMGFGEFTIVDPEQLDETNLNRFPGAGLKDVGTDKVDILERELRQVFPDTPVTKHACGVENQNAQVDISRADIIIAAVDGMAPRAELQVLAARTLKPLFDIGSGIRLDSDGNVKRMGSQVIAYLPGGPCLKCQGMDIFRPETGLAGEMRRKTGYVQGTDLTPTSVATINSIVAGCTVDMIMSYITGLRPIPCYVSFDLWSWEMHRHTSKKNMQCPVCGEEGIEGKGLPQP